jgi:hypothetical protein
MILVCAVPALLRRVFDPVLMLSLYLAIDSIRKS